MIKVIDNLVPKSFQNDIETLINDGDFAWYFYDSVTYNLKEITNKNITSTSALIHTVFDNFSPNSVGVNSPYYSFFKSILYFLDDKENINLKNILRIRIRRTLPKQGHTLKKYNAPHVDLVECSNYKSLVYYVEDSDGDTIFFNETKQKDTVSSYLNNVTEKQRVTPKKGTGIYFNGDIFHSGNNPVNFDKRTVINFDFETY